LLAAVGIEFTEERRETGRLFDHSSELTVVFGRLVSPRGIFRCQLRTSAGTHRFTVATRGDVETTVGILDDLERAFSGHLIDEKPVS